MSAATTFPEILDPHLQNLCYYVLTATQYLGGSFATGFIDRLGNAVPANSQLSGNVASVSAAGPAREVEITIRINPDGLTATARMVAQSPAGLQSVEGQLVGSALAGLTL